jgi:hypothetical protein
MGVDRCLRVGGRVAKVALDVVGPGAAVGVDAQLGVPPGERHRFDCAVQKVELGVEGVGGEQHAGRQLDGLACAHQLLDRHSVDRRQDRPGEVVRRAVRRRRLLEGARDEQLTLLRTDLAGAFHALDDALHLRASGHADPGCRHVVRLEAGRQRGVASGHQVPPLAERRSGACPVRGGDQGVSSLEVQGGPRHVGARQGEGLAVPVGSARGAHGCLCVRQLGDDPRLVGGRRRLAHGSLEVARGRGRFTLAPRDACTFPKKSHDSRVTGRLAQQQLGGDRVGHRAAVIGEEEARAVVRVCPRHRWHRSVDRAADDRVREAQRLPALENRALGQTADHPVGALRVDARQPCDAAGRRFVPQHGDGLGHASCLVVEQPETMGDGARQGLRRLDAGRQCVCRPDVLRDLANEEWVSARRRPAGLHGLGVVGHVTGAQDRGHRRRGEAPWRQPDRIWQAADFT